MKKCTLLLAIVMLVNIFGVFTVSASTENSASAVVETEATDSIYSESLALIDGLGIIPIDATSKANSTITRSTFATMLVYLMGIKEYDKGKVDSDNKYTGFNNDPVEDEWTWYDPNVAQSENTINTPFHDVTKEHENWENINIVANTGIMSGYDNNTFMPDRRMTLAEVIKILVCLNGSEELTGKDFPYGYYTQANHLDLLEDVNSDAIDEYITFRDLVVLIANFLNTDIFEQGFTQGIFNRTVTLDQTKNYTYLKAVFDIYTAHGIVDENQYTSLDSAVSLGDNVIHVQGKYLVGDSKSADFLGYCCEVYYRNEEDSKNHQDEVVYIRKDSCNEETIIMSDDIVDYVGQTLTYKTGVTSRKSIHIGADTIIIYNGIILNDYKDSDIVPTCGTVRLVENKSGSDVVFIENIDTYQVKAIDRDKSILYDALDAKRNIKVDADTIIRQANGNSATISDISEDAILCVKSTLDSQDARLVEITIAKSVVSGVITKTRTAKDKTYITLDSGEEYQLYILNTLSSDKKKELIAQYKVGLNADYYLDSFGKVVRFKNATETFSYAYITSGIYDDKYEEGTPDKVLLKGYSFDDGELKQFTLADRVRVNDSSYKLEKIRNSAALYDSVGSKFKEQLIKYRTDDNGTITEILTAYISDAETPYADKNKFAAICPEVEGGKYFRVRVSAADNKMYDDVPLFTFTSKTKVLRVPKDDEKKNDNDYYFFKGYEDNTDGTWQLAAYADDADSFTANVIIHKETVEASENAGTSAAYMVKDIQYLLDKDGDTIMNLTVVGYTGETQYEVSSDMMSVGEKLNVGDLVKFNVRSGSTVITYLDKVFDAKTRSLEPDDTWPEDQWDTAPYNPVTNPGRGWHGGVLTRSFLQNYSLLHGQIQSTRGNGEFITIAPYNYTGYGVKGEGVDTAPNRLYTVSAQQPNIYVFYSENDLVTSGGRTDLMTQESGAGSEIVYYSFWTTGRTIFIYK